MPRRLVTTLVASLSSLALVFAGAPSAFAMGQTPVPSWMTNGKQFATAVDADRIYFGGQFTQVRSTPLGSPGPRFTVDNVGAIDLSSGEGVSTFRPSVTHATEVANVRALALSADGSILYIGGKFDAVNGVKVRNVAALNTSDGSIVNSFKPTVGSLTNQVYSLLLSPDGSRLIVGGTFSKVEGATRKNLAAVNTADGSLVTTWSSSPNSNVRAMDLAPGGASIYIVGAFDSVDGVSRESIARINTTTGALDAWAVPGFLISGPPMTGWSVESSVTTVYAGFGRGPNWFGAYSATTGNQVWKRGTSGNTQKVLLTADGTNLIVGGHFGTGRLNQTFSECGSSKLFRGLLIANAATGVVDCTWVPELKPYGNNYQGIWDVELTPAHLWFAGNFSQVNGVDQANVARAAW